MPREALLCSSVALPMSDPAQGKPTMITLYQFQWCHYVEKVRWALAFKGLDWRGVEVVAFIKREMQQFDCAQTVPLIHDAATGLAISDSSPILRYLEDTYPQPALFPSDPAEREAAWQQMLHLDSTLGLHARRLGYTQLILECPQALSQLFMPDVAGGLFTRRGWRALAAPFLGAMLIRRFRFNRNRHDRVYESLEAQLLGIAAHLEKHRFLVGDAFTAADITLASLLRPLRIVPHFSDHSKLQSLFAWQEQLFTEHGCDPAFHYETIIKAAREKRGVMRGKVRWLRDGGTASSPNGVALSQAQNDIHPVSSWMLPLALPGYMRLRWFGGVGKARYQPAAFLSR